MHREIGDSLQKLKFTERPEICNPLTFNHLPLTNLLAMIYISDIAKDKLENLKKETGLEGEYFLRVSVVSGGCSGLSYKMDFDNVSQEGDEVFEDKGVKIVTDAKSFLYLFDTTLDYTGGLNGKGFYFNNPNASRSCSCGESFAL